MGRYSAVGLVFAFALAFVPTAAAATTLYATPGPAAGASCSAANPCALSTAIVKAASGDTVVVGVGTYAAETEYFDEGRNITIAGAAIGSGRPVVKGRFDLSGSLSRISDLEIDTNSAPPALELSGGASADRVLAINDMWDGCVIEGGAAITNSLCVSHDPVASSGLSSQGSAGPMAAHNVTLIGDTGYYSNNTSSPGLTLADSIAMTTHEGSGGHGASFGQGLTIAINSYFADAVSPEGVTATKELTEKPIFRGPGDYREASNSPTINAGSDAAGAGELDLNGNLRKIGAHTDVGAYEFVPSAPTIGAPSASPVTLTGATVNASINPQSGRTYYHVEYGPTSAHGSSTPTVVLPAGTSPTAVQVELGGYAPQTTVHYSVVATSDGGTTTTPDATLTTAASPAAGLKKLAPTLRFEKEKGGKPKGQPLLDRPAIKLQVRCGPVDCTATLKGTVKIGGKSYGTLSGPKQATKLAAGKQGTVAIKSSAKLRTRVRDYLEANPSARARVIVTATFVTRDATAGAGATRKLTIAVRPLGSTS